MEIIKQDDRIMAIIHRAEDWSEGLNFITPDSLFIQVGTWQYDKGTHLDSHIHKEYERPVTKTHEMAYVKKGRLKLFIYDEERKKVGDYILGAGDFVVLAEGGHGYEILEDDTQVLEAKTGPFVSVDKDKEKF
ncbi:MAG TPA: hypothetical protein QF499_09880 [Gammaproteobacteria bacterium]|jgi:hypothetical protein|nr:hypothetical protein [Chromatiales bacterium]MCP4925006.1 hypothetical protein [Gammaproteobacteria bacterium]MDP6095571.1 hypothetical protein [Gammaproteobacteria bacterium]HJP39421.1 hypothetical protein [Gammaproteobacteria bacterium]